VSGVIAALGLFSGVGGWEFHDAELGIRTTGIENNSAAADTAEAAGLHVQRQDVTQATLLPGHGYKLLKAGPPCQTFSAAGKGAGRKALDLVLDELDYLVKAAKAGSWRDQTQWIRYALFDDKRTGLVLEPMRYILAAVKLRQPFRAIVLEQVPAVLPVWQAYAEVLRELGYSVAVGILHAEQYGAPQTRKRAVLIARLDGEAHLPTPTHSKYHNRTPERLDEGMPSWVSLAGALGTTAWLSSSTQPNATHRHAAQPAPTLAFGNDMASFVFHNGEPDIRIAKATGCVQRLTVQEAAVLQTFPTDYPWQGTKTQQYQQVGNAIPPVLARAILKQVV
jgi:DNA (cytosine-5)-methyltransferase 1